MKRVKPPTNPKARLHNKTSHPIQIWDGDMPTEKTAIPVGPGSSLFLYKTTKPSISFKARMRIKVSNMMLGNLTYIYIEETGDSNGEQVPQ
jgi:hypothetical protein